MKILLFTKGVHLQLHGIKYYEHGVNFHCQNMEERKEGKPAPKAL